MSGKYKSLRANVFSVSLFILRNLILYSLLFNAYLHFQGELNLTFLTLSFILSLLLAIIMVKAKLRFLPAIIIAIIFSIFIRFIFFVFFSLFAPLDEGIEKDFIFFYFDKDFFPSLLPCFITWLFNFLSLRKTAFVHFEVGLNALLLALIFHTQTNYNITLYHPTLYGIYLGVFIIIEIIILIIFWFQQNRDIIKGNYIKKKGKYILSFLWILIPLILLLVFYLFLMDRYNKEAIKSRGGLMESTLFRFDFSKYIKLQSEIKLNDDLVLLFRKNGPAQRLLLRRFVLSEYLPGRGFYQSRNNRSNVLPTVVPDKTIILPDPGFENREEVEQEYFFINFDPSSLIAMNYPITITPLKNWENSSFLRIYSVKSKVSQFQLYEELDVLPITDLKPDQFDFYTEYGDDEKIKELASAITEEYSSYLEKVIAIKDYLQENYLYSLKPGIAKDGNQLHHFLFNSKKGYCSYFAFAMTLMCRSLGIPARVAVGFFINPDWEVLNFYEIRSNQAHAWVEVFFENLGWIEFDPTSTNVAPGEDISFMFDFSFNDKFKNLIAEILKNQDQLIPEVSTKTEINNSYMLFSDIFIKITSWLAKYWFALVPCLYLIFILVLKYYKYILFLFSYDIRKKTKWLYKHSLSLLYGLGMGKRLSESPSDYAKRIECESSEELINLSELTKIYLKAVFGNTFYIHDYKKFIKVYKGFIKSFKQYYNIFIRIFGILNPLNSLKRKYQ